MNVAFHRQILCTEIYSDGVKYENSTKQYPFLDIYYLITRNHEPSSCGNGKC